MLVFTEPLSLKEKCLNKSVVTLGNFDGVHLGHQHLINTTIKASKELKIPAIAIMFDPHPVSYFNYHDSFSLLMPVKERLLYLEQLGVDYVLVLPFDKNQANQEAVDFVKDVLVSNLNAQKVVIGYDYSFGYGRKGNYSLLLELGKNYGFEVEQVSPFIINNQIVSSTSIRSLLNQGDFKTASSYLGRPYYVTGNIVKGKQRGGSSLGFPTANLDIEKNWLLPKPGVIAVLSRCFDDNSSTSDSCIFDSKNLLLGVASLGYNSTFGDEGLHLEVHLLNFSEDIYGKNLQVYFFEWMRAERRFESKEELIAKIREDVKQGEEILNKILKNLSSSRN